MKRSEKEVVVEELTDIFSKSKVIYMTDFTGLNVEEMTELRSRLRDMSASYKVVKNTLALLAMERAGLKDFGGLIDGTVGLAFTDKDEIASAKVIVEFAKKKRERPKVKSGIIDGKVIGPEDIVRLANLPSREQLLAMVSGGMGAPLNSFLQCLNGIMRNLLYALNSLSEKRKEEEGMDG